MGYYFRGVYYEGDRPANLEQGIAPGSKADIEAPGTSQGEVRLSAAQQADTDKILAERAAQAAVDANRPKNPEHPHIPADAKPVAWDWMPNRDLPGNKPDPTKVDKTKPTTFELNGIQYFTERSPEYIRGFENSKEKNAVDSDASQAPHVAVTTDSGRIKHISRDEAAALNKLEGDQRFAQMQAMGLIDKGAEWIEGNAYKSAAQVKAERQFNELSKQLREIKAVGVAKQIEITAQTKAEIQALAAIQREVPATKTVEGKPIDLSKYIIDMPRIKQGATFDVSDALRTLPFLAAAVPVVRSTPMPHDDLVLWAIIGSVALAGYTAKQLADAGVIQATYNELQKIKDTFRQRTGRNLSTNDMVVVDTATMKSIPMNIPDEWLKQPIPPTKQTRIENNETIKPGRALDTGSKIVPPYVAAQMETIAPKTIGAIYLPTPKTSISDVEGRAAGLMTAQAAVDTARESIPDKYDNILDDARTEIDIRDAFKEIDRQVDADIRDREISIEKSRAQSGEFADRQAYLNDLVRQRVIYHSARDEYLAKLRIYTEAKKSYVASLNPQPLNGGKANYAAQNVAAMAYLARLVQLSDNPKLKNITKIDIATITQPYTGTQTKTATTTGVMVQPAVKTATRTATRTQTLTNTAVKPATQTQTQTQTKTATRAATKAQTKTQTQTRTATKAAEATRAATRAGTRAATNELTRTAENTRTMTKIRIKKLPPPLLPKGASQEKEWTRADIKSAIAWKAGIVIHAIKSPYRRGIDEKSYALGKEPAGLKVLETNIGAKVGTAQGKVPARITTDVGNQDAVITRKGNRIKLSYHQDAGSRTISQTTIKKNNGHNLSKRKGRVYYTRSGGDMIISERGLRGY